MERACGARERGDGRPRSEEGAASFTLPLEGESRPARWSAVARAARTSGEANQIQWQVSQGDQRYVALSNVILNHVVRTRSKRETDKRSARRFARPIGG